MSDRKVVLEAIEAIAAEQGNPLAWYWLSFVDVSRPKGQQFLGACIVQARGIATAVREAHLRGCNPGGQVKVVGPSYAPLQDWANRLLSKDQCAEFAKLHGVKLVRTPPAGMA